MKKIWNQDKTIKYLPSNITKWEIREPGGEEVVGRDIVKLTKYKINAQGSEGYFVIGYYDTKENAVAEVDRLDALGVGDAEAEEPSEEEKGGVLDEKNV